VESGTRKADRRKNSLYREFYRQKDEVHKVEIIPKAAKLIMRRRGGHVTKNQGMEL